MYEFIILSQLMQGARHGYLIAKIINDIIGPYARLSPGRLYPLLAKMVQNGLIEMDEKATENPRKDHQLRAYKITETGQMRFHILMKDTSSNLGDYQKLFNYKVCAFDLITPIERVTLIDHYIHYCQSHILHHQSEADDLTRNGQKYAQLSSSNLKFDFTIEMLHHSIDEWQNELSWAKRLRAKEFSHYEQTNSQELIIQEENP